MQSLFPLACEPASCRTSRGALGGRSLKTIVALQCLGFRREMRGYRGREWALF